MSEDYYKNLSVVNKDNIIGKVFLVIGWFLVGYWSLSIVVGLIQNSFSSSYIAASLLVIIIGFFICFPLISFGKSKNSRVKRFNQYIMIIHYKNATTIDQIALNSSQTAEFVLKDIKDMFHRNYFKNIYLDTEGKRIVFDQTMTSKNNEVPKSETVEKKKKPGLICKNCGGENVENAKTCEYCGSPIN